MLPVYGAKRGFDESLGTWLLLCLIVYGNGWGTFCTKSEIKENEKIQGLFV